MIIEYLFYTHTLNQFNNGLQLFYLFSRKMGIFGDNL